MAITDPDKKILLMECIDSSLPKIVITEIHNLAYQTEKMKTVFYFL